MKNETELGTVAKEYISKGLLLPDNLICDMLDKVLDRLPADTKGVIFDGFPRTIPQAESLEGILQKRGWDVTILIDLQVDDEELLKRLIERGRSSGRADDNEKTIKSRLAIYHTQTAPLAEYYKNRKKHIAVKGIGTIEEIFNRIGEEIERCLLRKDNRI
jgi:adenylate kinase